MACENVTTKIYSELLENYNLSSLLINLENLTVQMTHNIHNKTTIVTTHLKIIHYVNQCKAGFDELYVNKSTAQL